MIIDNEVFAGRLSDQHSLSLSYQLSQLTLTVRHLLALWIICNNNSQHSHQLVCLSQQLLYSSPTSKQNSYENDTRLKGVCVWGGGVLHVRLRQVS